MRPFVAAVVLGLSPLARGNPKEHLTERHTVGSIPARTGEPIQRPHCSIRGTVYPRSHGGTAIAASKTRGAQGLSPLARGNPQTSGRQCHQTGSIPARTGEPRSDPGNRCARRVYPRSHGGTTHLQTPRHDQTGLSPLARGNQVSRQAESVCIGSIPARTGEPRVTIGSPALARVYPRSHGGTRSQAIPTALQWGLSPLARGNPLGRPSRLACPGSIPARTGEPDWIQSEWCTVRVYPRSHGGTVEVVKDASGHWGLSPLARGNLL